MRLRDYQETAVGFLRANPRAGLFLDMGLGKTAICLTALQPHHLPALIVAPKRVAETVWLPERDIWRQDLTGVVIEGTPARRAQLLAATPKDLTVVSWDRHGDILDIPTTARPWRTVIIDELSGMKDRGSVRWKVLNKIIHHPQSNVEHVWGLTGTPVPNGYMNLWSQVYLLDKGERLGKTLTAYRDRYFRATNRLPNGIVTKWDLRPDAEKAILSKIGDLCLAMDGAGRVDVAEPIHNEVKVTLSTRDSKIYRDMEKDLVVDLQVLGGEIHTAREAAILTGKLSQITAGFIYSDDRDVGTGKTTELHKAKINAVVEIIEETGSPVLVAYRFEEELAALRAALPQGRTINEPGVIADWNTGKVPVLFAHPASAGHGLNLQHGGHTIVWATLTWSLEEWQQFNRRLARPGQKNQVVIHRVMACTADGRATVDQLIHDVRLKGKNDVQATVLDYLESPV